MVGTGRSARSRALTGQGGFTLIELLITVTIIGVLATVSITAYGNARESAYYATLRAELSRLAKAQEAYWETRMSHRRGPRYGTLRQLRRTANFQPSQNVTLNIRARPAGWSARARHASLPRRAQCSMYVGSGARPYPPAGNAGVIGCR